MIYTREYTTYHAIRHNDGSNRCFDLEMHKLRFSMWVWDLDSCLGEHRLPESWTLLT